MKKLFALSVVAVILLMGCLGAQAPTDKVSVPQAISPAATPAATPVAIGAQAPATAAAIESEATAIEAEAQAAADALGELDVGVLDIGPEDLEA